MLTLILLIATCKPFQIQFDIMMKEHDEGSSDEDIDSFGITISLSSGYQEEVYTGITGIAIITLSYEITCIDPHPSTTTTTSSELIGKECTCIYK